MESLLLVLADASDARRPSPTTDEWTDEDMLQVEWKLVQGIKQLYGDGVHPYTFN